MTTAEIVVQVRHDLDQFVARQREALADLGLDLEAFLDQAHAAVSGGKGLRASFCHAGWVAAGGSPRDPAAVRAAGALEWLQASALVHDDVMDGSDTRRGRPASHRAFEGLHRADGWRGDSEQFGVCGAILLGDLLMSWCDETFRTSGLPFDVLAAAAPYLDACKTEVVCGQYLDVAAQARGDASVEAAMRVVRYKSAKYSVERPLHLGAALAGAGPDLVGSLSDFGLPLGEAFQLRDDVLGVFGDPAVTGKPAGDDLREGKRTALVAYAAESADEAERGLLEAHLGDAALDPATLDRMRETIVATGALDRVEAEITKREEQASDALATAPLASEAARALLHDLAERATRRTS